MTDASLEHSYFMSNLTVHTMPLIRHNTTNYCAPTDNSDCCKLTDIHCRRSKLPMHGLPECGAIGAMIQVPPPRIKVEQMLQRFSPMFELCCILSIQFLCHQ